MPSLITQIANLIFVNTNKSSTNTDSKEIKPKTEPKTSISSNVTIYIVIVKFLYIPESATLPNRVATLLPTFFLTYIFQNV